MRASGEKPPAAAAPARTAGDTASPRLPRADASLPRLSQGDTAWVPVQVGGGHEDFDACGSVGRIQVPDNANRDFVEVRRGPGRRFSVADRLRAGDEVLLCDRSDADGRWSGVVYSEDREDFDCGGLTSPIAERQPYRGPCRSGWIAVGAIEVIAG